MPPGMDPPELLAVLGSVTSPGRLRRAVTEGLDRSDRPTGLLDLAEVPLPFADGAHPDPATAEVIARVTVARSVLLATPVYRGSFTGALKNLLDLLPVEALEGKPVAILAMGASAHHFLGAERHLRDVLAFFGAHVAPVAGYLTSKDFTDGEPGDAAAESIDRLVAGTLGLRVALAGGQVTGLRPLTAR